MFTLQDWKIAPFKTFEGGGASTTGGVAPAASGIEFVQTASHNVVRTLGVSQALGLRQSDYWIERPSDSLTLSQTASEGQDLPRVASHDLGLTSDAGVSGGHIPPREIIADVVILTGTTVDKNTWVTLLEEGQPLVVPPSTTWLFDARVVGRAVDVPKNAGLTVSGVVVRNGSAAPYIVGTKKTTIARSGKSMKADAVEDVPNNAVAIQVRGVKDEDVNWVARVEVTPITG